MSALILETRGLSKHFGGLRAVSDISLQVAPREIHAIIGPNGAGKSTMVNLLSGHLRPSSGQVIFNGQDITGLAPNKVSHLGVGRSFQRTNIFPSFSCLENCMLAAQALDACGLSSKGHSTASSMSYGEQRQLEIGMVLATEPSFLLLDEPMAGMGKEESSRVVELLAELSREYSLVLVEHDMEAVFSIAKTLTVMVNGQMLASGPLDQVRNDPAVQEAYLGDGEEQF